VSVGRFLATLTPIVLDYQNTDITRLCLRRQRFGTLAGWISSPNPYENPRCGALPAMLDLHIKPRPRTTLLTPTHLFAHYQNNHNTIPCLCLQNRLTLMGCSSVPRIRTPTAWRRFPGSAVDIKHQSRIFLQPPTKHALMTKYRDELLHVCFSKLGRCVRHVPVF